MSVNLKLNSLTKVYHEGDKIKGSVIVESKSVLVHQGVVLTLEGNAVLSLSSKNVGRLEAMYSNSKPIPIFLNTLDLVKAGKFQEGITELPFEMSLQPSSSSNIPLYETYQGVNIQIQYNIKCLVKRPLLNKDLTAICEILVEYKKGEQALKKPLRFHINPQSIENLKSGTLVPDFSIKGEIDSSVCRISQPLTGELTIEKSEMSIRSIELQLLRVETVGSAEYHAKNSSEIQNIEIGSGDVIHNLSIPIYMVLPRLFACPTLDTINFKIEFELNIAIMFTNDVVITENFPLRLTRF